MFEKLDINGLIQLKQSKGSLRLYLSHEPFDERHARHIAEQLEKEGIEVMVAADYRGGICQPPSEEDIRNVTEAIKNADAVIYLPPKRSE